MKRLPNKILDKPITTMNELRAHPGVAELAFERDMFMRRWQKAERTIAKMRALLGTDKAA